MKVLVTYNLFQGGFTELEKKHEVTFPKERTFSRKQVLDIISDYDVLCPMFNFEVNKELIDKAPNLKLVSNYAVGYDNIDIAYCLEKGITVCNTPSATTLPTANLTFGLLLDVARRITYCDKQFRNLGQSLKVGLLENMANSVTNQTLGILGMGRIGKAVAERANAFGMEVIYNNRHPYDIEEETRYNVTYVSKEELLKSSDFVSVNAPLTSETFHLISTDEFKQMKNSAFLINTSRGPLVDELALIEALKNGEIKGAGLDVFEFGLHPSPALLEMENVVLTPHIGTQTSEARIHMAQVVCDNVIGFFDKDRRIYRVLHP